MVMALLIQPLVVTAFLGTGAGVHLYYFSLGGSLGMFFVAGHEVRAVTLTFVATALFLVCHFAFPPGTTLLAIDRAAEELMYTANAPQRSCSLVCSPFCSGSISTAPKVT